MRVAVEEPASADVRIERLASGGEGVGHLAGGLTIFVPYTAPGDLVTVRIHERRRRHARGEILRLLESGPARVEPRCAVFGRCGGCAWQHIDYQAQLHAKQEILRDALQRIGGVATGERPRVLPSPKAFGYRARTRLLERDGALGYRERRSHALCAARTCPILMPVLERRLAELADEVAGDPRPAEREWELACGRRGDVRATPLEPVDARAGRERIHLEIAGDLIGLSPGTFSQGNGLLLGALHEAVCEAVGGGRFLLELHAGAGFFSLSLARHFERVQLVESDAGAVADLRTNLAAAGLERVVVTPIRVEESIPDQVDGAPDVILVDPPRAGLDERVLADLAGLEPDRVVYLSCDPATLARDIARFRERGYALRSIEGFDLFPQTPHVEALAILTSSDAEPRSTT